MFKISYLEMFILTTIIWIAIRFVIAVKNHVFDWKRELKLLTVYICIIVIFRIVYFPWHLENGHVGALIFDSQRIVPIRINLIPFVHMVDIYEGWQRNLFGNIAMFIPVGIFWPLCFKKLDRVWKVVLAGGGFSLLIEISQLLFYDRGTDIDDLITNTTGVLIGAGIYFLVRRITLKKSSQNT